MQSFETGKVWEDSSKSNASIRLEAVRVYWYRSAVTSCVEQEKLSSSFRRDVCLKYRQICVFGNSHGVMEGI